MLGANIGQDVGRTIFVKDFYFNAVSLDIYIPFISNLPKFKMMNVSLMIPKQSEFLQSSDLHLFWLIDHGGLLLSVSTRENMIIMI